MSTLILAEPPQVGRAYHLTPIIGYGLAEQTAICRQLLKRDEWVGNEIWDKFGNTLFEGETYTDEYWQFADIDTGELFTVMVEVQGGIDGKINRALEARTPLTHHTNRTAVPGLVRRGGH